MIYYYPDQHVDVVQLGHVVALWIAILVVHVVASSVVFKSVQSAFKPSSRGCRSCRTLCETSRSRSRGACRHVVQARGSWQPPGTMVTGHTPSSRACPCSSRSHSSPAHSRRTLSDLIIIRDAELPEVVHQVAAGHCRWSGRHVASDPLLFSMKRRCRAPRHANPIVHQQFADQDGLILDVAFSV
jgi:hypothetical protein